MLSSMPPGTSANSASEQQSQVRDLIHRLRQPLSTIETCACYLRLVLPEEASRMHAQLDTIEKQVEDANRILVEWMNQVRREASEAAERRSFTKAEMAGVTY